MSHLKHNSFSKTSIQCCSNVPEAFACLKPLATLPRYNIIVGWVFALLIVFLFSYLGITLNSDAREFSYGVPAAAHVSLVLMALNAIFGLAVVVLAVRQWLQASGERAARVFYSLLAIVAVCNLWIAYYFNILNYVLN